MLISFTFFKLFSHLFKVFLLPFSVCFLLSFSSFLKNFFTSLQIFFNLSEFCSIVSRISIFLQRLLNFPLLIFVLFPFTNFFTLLQNYLFSKVFPYVNFQRFSAFFPFFLFKQKRILLRNNPLFNKSLCAENIYIAYALSL